MTKRIVILILILALALSFASCKKNAENNGEKSGSETAVEMTPIPDDATGSTISGRNEQDESDTRGNDEIYENADTIINTITQFTGFNTAEDTEFGSNRTFNVCDKAGFDEYVKKLQELGFTKNVSSKGNKDQNKYYYLAQDKDGVYAEVRVNDKETVISVFSNLSYIGK